jgi:hypothetical protein
MGKVKLSVSVHPSVRDYLIQQAHRLKASRSQVVQWAIAQVASTGDGDVGPVRFIKPTPAHAADIMVAVKDPTEAMFESAETTIKSEYLRTGEGCPFCGPEAEVVGGNINIGANYAVQGMHCLDCHKEWNADYRLVHVEEP